MSKLTKKEKDKINEEIIKQIVEEANFLLEDKSIPRNITNILSNIEKRLKTNLNVVEVSTIVYELEETTNSVNMTEYRSVVWSIISKLEGLKENLK
ncbi:MAG TPA: UPF0147 family protein [archaeon]|jgi:uncharacterized protein (UPF0147 family)|nr:MAG: hypothetical protein BWY55_00609 [archaeon ADurb.Bin336]HOD89860.1 UPF0147 family protein [archaeon]HPC09982.1 UPF0147 family protein [archaeon]HRT03036.1 UPF0147 family protein [Candidatus Diapherotrites archaeon]